MLGSVIIFGKAKAEIGIVPFQSGTLAYSGAAQSPVWNGFNSNAMEIGGKTSATNAGTYSATFTPKEGYVWSDGTTDMKTVQWTIHRAAVSVPTAKAAQTYTGSELTAQWNGYDSGKMTIGGTVKGTNAGTYNATFTPGANYQWPDGSTAAKTVSWSIAKAAGSLSINKTSMTFNLSSLTGTITVNRAGDGAVTASSSNTSIAIMPEEWRNVIEACTKYNDEDNDGDTVVTTLDQIWIPAGFEVFGTKASTWSSEHNYQEQYNYYKNGNSKVKY